MYDNQEGLRRLPEDLPSLMEDHNSEVVVYHDGRRDDALGTFANDLGSPGRRHQSTWRRQLHRPERGPANPGHDRSVSVARCRNAPAEDACTPARATVLTAGWGDSREVVGALSNA